MVRVREVNGSVSGRLTPRGSPWLATASPSGRLVVTLPEGNQIHSRLVGTFNPQSRSLTLRDEHPDARFVEYNLVLDMPNLTMQGTLTQRDRTIEPCVMVRSTTRETRTTLWSGT